MLEPNKAIVTDILRAGGVTIDDIMSMTEISHQWQMDFDFIYQIREREYGSLTKAQQHNLSAILGRYHQVRAYERN